MSAEGVASPLTSRRTLVGLLAIAVLVVVGIVGGRHEGRHETDRQLAGIAAVAAAVGPLDRKTIDAWRDDGLLACLDYSSGTTPYALQLCFDPVGRLVEAVDRRKAQPVYWSVAYRPSLARISIGPGGFAAIAHRSGVPKSRLGR